MLGALVSRTPSRPSRASALANALTRAGRRSATTFALRPGGRVLRAPVNEHRRQPAERPLVAVRTEAAEYRACRRRKHRVTSLGLARIDVGQVDFDKGDRNGCQRIANGQTRMTVRPSIDDGPIGVAAKGVDRVDERAF